MKIKLGALLLLLSVPSVQSEPALTKKHIKAYKQMKQKNRMIDLLPSTGVSCLVGCFTGALARYIEKELNIGLKEEDFVFLMIAWWLEYQARSTVIYNLEKDFYEADVPHRKGLMKFSAWVSSWLAYLKME